MTNHITAKSVIITGAGNGFGKLTAIRLANHGARVVCADIDGTTAEATAAEIRNTGGEALGIAADVTVMDHMHHLAEQTVQAFGAIDVLVNNAGIMPLAWIADHKQALTAWQRCIDINLKGVMHGTLAVHDQMMAQGRGHVVNIASIFGNHPVAGGAVYGATKAAVDYFSHAFRQEARGRIKVTVIKPTAVMATGLNTTVVNSEAGGPIVGHNAAEFFADFAAWAEGTLSPAKTSADSMGYAFLEPEYIVDAIVHVINQPWGVAISDITVRASGDHFIP